jgi:hypothetical protein
VIIELPTARVRRRAGIVEEHLRSAVHMLAYARENIPHCKAFAANSSSLTGVPHRLGRSSLEAITDTDSTPTHQDPDAAQHFGDENNSTFVVE